MQAENIKSTQYYLLFVFTILIYALAWYLAATRGLNCTLEGESGMTAREFLRTGDWTVNHMNGRPDYDKPSFFYWLIALASLFTGSVTELAVRIPSLLSSACIMAMFRLYRHDQVSKNLRFALPAVAAFIFIASPKVFWMTQVGRIDMTLNMLCFAIVSSFVMYLSETLSTTKKTLFYWAFFVASGVAVLTKGPVGVLISWPPVFLFLLLKKNWRELRRFFLGPGIILFMLITLPWYLNACISTDWEFFRHFFLEESVSRFGNLFKGIEFKQFNHSAKGIYLVYFLTGFFPWSLILPVAAWLFLRKNREEPWQKRFKPTMTHKVMFLYIGWVFLFFSLCGVKRSDYILPLYPAAALVTADFLMRLFESEKNIYRQIFERISVALSCILAIICIVASVLSVALISDTVQQAVSPLLPPRLGGHLEWFGNHYLSVISATLLAFFAVSIYWLVFRRSKYSSSDAWSKFMRLACTITATWMIAAGAVLPFIYYCKDMRAWCENIDHIMGSSPVYTYHFWDEECAFYLDRPQIAQVPLNTLKELLTRNDRRVFILVREKNLRQIDQAGIKIPWMLKPEEKAWRRLYLLSNEQE